MPGSAFRCTPLSIPDETILPFFPSSVCCLRVAIRSAGLPSQHRPVARRILVLLRLTAITWISRPMERFICAGCRASYVPAPSENGGSTIRSGNTVLKNTIRRGEAITIASCLSVAALTMPASAAALFVHTGPTKAPGPNTCVGFAVDAANHQHLQNIRHDNSSVSGAKGDKFVAITCVGTVVVIAVAGDHPPEVKPLADAIFDDISRMIKID